MRRALPVLALLLLSVGTLRAEPLVPGLKVRQVDRAFQAVAAASGVMIDIGKPECSPGMPGFFCSYSTGPGLRLIAGAPTLSGDIDSLEVESTGHAVSEPLRRLLALAVAVLESQSAPRTRAELLEHLLAATQAGPEATVRGRQAEFTFNRFGYGLVFSAKPAGE